MSGYVPLFDSLTKGTLCGRWPDIGLWPIVLSLSDKNGVVDVTFGYLANVTGLGLEEVQRCMARFCRPDPASRSPDSNGARLTLLDEHRAWGWHIVNHAQYREKARLAAKSANEVASGLNLKRMQDRRSPPITAADPPSDSYADANSNAKKDSKNTTAGVSVEFEHLKAIYPHRAGANPWNKALKACHGRIAQGATWDELIEGARRYQAFCKTQGRIGTEFVMQAATFFGPEDHFRNPWNPPPTKADVLQDSNIANSQEWLNERR